MELSEFQEEEFAFLEKVKTSEEYQRMKKLSREIEEDPELTSLAKRRDALFLEAENEKDPSKKQALLRQFKEEDDALRSSPKMKEYLSLYQQVRKILVALQDSLTKEIL